MNFKLALTEKLVKPHQTIALHLVAAFVMAGLGGSFYMLRAHADPAACGMLGIAGTGLTVAGLLLGGIIFSRNKWLLRSRINRAFRLAELAVILSLSIFFLTLQWLVPAGIAGILAGALAFALYWERESNQALYISIGPEGIRLPHTTRRKRLEWPEIERVLLRFGVLSVDCRDNHLFQWNIRKVDFDHKEFEAWCLQQIEAGRSKRKQNGW